MNKKTTACALAVLLSLAFMSSCIGPMNASKRLHTWNREVENRWAGEGVFLVLRVVYIYPLAFLGDVLIFNSIEFWGGNNPIDPPSAERLKALAVADAAAASGD